MRYNSSGGFCYVGATNSAAPDIVFSNGSGTESGRFTTNGNLQVGATTGTTTIRFFARGSAADSGSWPIYIENGTPAAVFTVRGDGYFQTGSAAFSPYNYTTGNAANVFIDAAGGLIRSTSSLKYKSDVQDAYYGLSNLLQLRPVTYKAKNDGNKVFGGLIAEEVDAAGLKEFVVYRDDDGTPDGLAYGNMVSLCIKAIQELNAKVDAQAAEIAALKAGA